MFKTISILFAAFCAALAFESVSAADVAPCADKDGWNDPAPPRQIYGDTWYVGTCGISTIRVTSPQGHILIDGGTQKAPALIEGNIRAAGFRFEDIRHIVNSHEHPDHVGGIAQLQRDSHAVVLAREPATTALEHGRGDRRDPQFLSNDSFPTVTNVRRIVDGDKVQVGPVALTAHATDTSGLVDTKACARYAGAAATTLENQLASEAPKS